MKELPEAAQKRIICHVCLRVMDLMADNRERTIADISNKLNLSCDQVRRAASLLVREAKLIGEVVSGFSCYRLPDA